MAERFQGSVRAVEPAQERGEAPETLWPFGPLWFSERALVHARAVYLRQELEAGASLWGAEFVTGILNMNLRGVGRSPLVLARLPDGRVVVRHAEE